MRSKEIKDRIDTLVSELKKSSKSKKILEKVEELIKLQEEYYRFPAHFRIDEEDVEESYDAGSFSLHYAGGKMHYKAKGGYDVFVERSYISLFNTMRMWLGLLNEYKDKGDEESQNIVKINDLLSAILFSPAFLTTDEDTMLEAGQFYEKALAKLYEASLAKLKEEDHEKNSEYVNGIKNLISTSEGLQELADKIKDGDTSV